MSELVFLVFIVDRISEEGILSLVEYIFYKVMIVIVVEGQGRCARIG